MKTLLLINLLNLFAAKNDEAITIHGQVLSTEQKNLSGATITVISSIDSSVQKIEISNQLGAYEMSFNQCQDYTIQVLQPGFQPYIKTITCKDFTQSSLQLDIIMKAAKQIGEISIRASKPFITRLHDRYSLSVENSPLTGANTALDVLSKAPAVSVQSNDNITIKGRSGIKIMLNGKPIAMGNADLANYLKSIPANAIDKVDIITNPSSQYDAAGSAGIIDIKLKKSMKLGTNGSIQGSWGQGVYPKGGAGFTLNNKSEKFSFNSLYQYNGRTNLNDLRLTRTFYNGSDLLLTYDQKNYLTMPSYSHMGRLAVDFNLDDQTILGFSTNANFSGYDAIGLNKCLVYDNQNQFISYFSTTNNSNNFNPSGTLNIYYTHQWDSSKRNIAVDADVMKFSYTSQQLFKTSYNTASGIQSRPDYLLRGDVLGHLYIKSFKVDFEDRSSRVYYKIGSKLSDVTADNKLDYLDISDPNQSRVDPNSNHFIYRETITAAYAEAGTSISKLDIKGGLRGEFTHIRGNQVTTQTALNKSYLNVFPTLYLSYPISNLYDMGWSFSRRLDRPTYEQLNPFKFILDPTTYKTGNPDLNPQFSWNLEWNHTWKKKYFLSLSYSTTQQAITEIVGPVENADKLTVQTNINLASNINYAINLSVPMIPFKWWSIQNDINAWYGYYEGIVAQSPLSRGNAVCQFNSNNNLKLNNRWSGDINFTYTSPMVYAYMEFQSLWGLDLSIQHKFDQNRGTIKLSATDIFWTNRPVASNEFTDYKETFDIYRDNRIFMLNISYRFGNSKIEPLKRREGSGEEEKKRAVRG